MRVTGDLPTNLSYLTRGPVFPTTLPFQNNLPTGLSHLVQSPSTPSLWSRFISPFVSAVRSRPAGQQFLVWGGIGSLFLNAFFGSERSTFGSILNFALSIAGIASLFVQPLVLPIAAIYAARGLWSMATGNGFSGLMDLVCAIPAYSIFKNWGNIARAATRLQAFSSLTGRAGISTTSAYLRTIARYSFGPVAGRQVSQVARAFSRSPRETFGHLAEGAGQGLGYYCGRFTDGIRGARNAAVPASLTAGAGI